MHAFHIHYRNTQGTLMRILTAVSRRGLDLHYVRAASAGNLFRADLLLEVAPKQIGQLCRDWYAIVDVTEVKYGAPSSELLEAFAFSGPHPPISANASGRNASAVGA
jgi:acetolactate synthase regulatory subunit